MISWQHRLVAAICLTSSCAVTHFDLFLKQPQVPFNVDSNSFHSCALITYWLLYIFYGPERFPDSFEEILPCPKDVCLDRSFCDTFGCESFGSNAVFHELQASGQLISGCSSAMWRPFLAHYALAMRALDIRMLCLICVLRIYLTSYRRNAHESACRSPKKWNVGW